MATLLAHLAPMGLALPVLPAVAPVAAGALAFFGFRKAQQEKAAFTSMHFEHSGVDYGESCVILGEESAANGKIWFVCDEQSADMECSPVAGLGNPDSLDDQWLCKQPKLVG